MNDPTRNLPSIEAHRHAEIIESLWRISTTLEALNRTAEKVSRQLADSVARSEATLQLAVKSWQAVAPKRGPRP